MNASQLLVFNGKGRFWGLRNKSPAVCSKGVRTADADIHGLDLQIFLRTRTVRGPAKQTPLRSQTIRGSESTTNLLQAVSAFSYRKLKPEQCLGR